MNTYKKTIENLRLVFSFFLFFMHWFESSMDQDERYAPFIFRHCSLGLYASYHIFFSFQSACAPFCVFFLTEQIPFPRNCLLRLIMFTSIFIMLQWWFFCWYCRRCAHWHSSKFVSKQVKLSLYKHNYEIPKIINPTEGTNNNSKTAPTNSVQLHPPNKIDDEN